MRRAKNWIFLLFALVLTAAVFFLLSKFRPSSGGMNAYAVTAQQWQEAFGDKAYIQTIYRNVTIEIHKGDEQAQMILATASGNLMLDNRAQDMKLICVSTANGFTTHIYQYSGMKWTAYDGKTEVVDDCLNTYLPGYVDMAMAGLQDEFEKAAYNAEEKCYIISQSASSGENAMMHCRVYFEHGKLIRLETEIVTNNAAQTLKLYNIGKTKVEAPADNQNG